MDEKYYFYILARNDNTKYYGHTNNLKRRVKDHSSGKVASTKNKRPIQLVYFEELSTRSEAFRREQQFKDGKTRKEKIQNLINSFPREKCQGFNSHL